MTRNLLLEPGDPDHEELVQGAAEDAQEPQALEQRDLPIASLLEDPFEEGHGRKLAIDEIARLSERRIGAGRPAESGDGIHTGWPVSCVDHHADATRAVTGFPDFAATPTFQRSARSASAVIATAIATQSWAAATTRTNEAPGGSTCTLPSARSESIGSTRAARRAGAQQARAATPARSTATERNVAGSTALTWYSTVCSDRVRTN